MGRGPGPRVAGRYGRAGCSAGLPTARCTAHHRAPGLAGTPPDVAARAVASKLPELLKQPVVIGEQARRVGTIGLSEVARSADGYTLGELHFATATVASLYPRSSRWI